MKLIRNKIAVQFVSSNFTVLAGFALSIALARLLTPTEIGIFSMSAVYISIAHVFRDFGVSNYLRQEKIVTIAIIRSASGVTLVTSLAMAILIFFSASIWADFLGDPRVEDVVHVLALGFIFIPFGAIPQALLMREMDAKRTALVSIATTVVYSAASLSLAYMGCGYMTMAWANLINILVSGAAFNLVLKARLTWMPSFNGWGKIIHFGAGDLVAALAKAADTALPDVLLGKMSTPAAVGLFSRANSTVGLVGMAIGPTIHFFALSHIAKTHHAQGKIDQEFLRASSIVNCIVLPALVAIAIMAHDIVVFLYGPQWLGCIEAVKWLCLAFGINGLFALTKIGVTGIGKPYAAIAPLVLALFTKVVLVMWLFDGDLRSFAMAIALGQIASIPCYLWVNSSYLGVNLSDWVKVTFKTMIPPAVSAAVLTAMELTVVEGLPVLWRLLLSVGVLAVVVIASFFILRLPIADEIRKAIKRAK